uniref:Dynein heavy chain n=1 Tax=Alexandrium monilatum TaxID=311494 RepID=A0A7S4VS10_9DINO
MGSEEGFSIADKAIIAASKSGQWVLLKNVHLAIKWLIELEKKLYSMNPSQNFRLFLTLEFNPRIPANLIRLSRVYVFEPPSGVKASLQRSFTQVLSADRTDRQPVERCRLHFLLAFLHAVVLERLRYFPVGWSKKYEFSDADQACGRDVIDAWVDNVSQGGKLSNISPDKIPWDAIQAILGEAMYGGRVDNEFDHVILKAFIKHLFREESFNSDFFLNTALSEEHRLRSPDGRKRGDFLTWIESLPAKGSPTWIGLPEHAEQMLRINRANHTLGRWLLLQGAVRSVPKAIKPAGSKGRASITGNPLDALGNKVKQMLSMLPESLYMMERSEASLGDPLWRCFDREMGVGGSLLGRVRADLNQLKGVCEGLVKTTNEIRNLIHDLNTDSVPKQWKRYAVADITVTEWLADFILRLDQLRALRESDNLQRALLWMGGLFFPEAFLTASRQAIAQKMQLSLEELLLVVDVGNTNPDEESFIVKGLYVEGAAWDTQSEELKMTDELTVAMPATRLRWVHRDSADYKQTADFLRIPVYLNTSRSLLISSFNLKSPMEIPQAVWLQRSVCLTLWTKS